MRFGRSNLAGDMRLLILKQVMRTYNEPRRLSWTHIDTYEVGDRDVALGAGLAGVASILVSSKNVDCLR